VAPRNGEALAVDLGCGTGVVTMELARRGFRVIGVDHSPEMLERAREKVAAAGMSDRVELRREDLMRAELPLGEADVVTCQGVLHHLPDMRPCVEAIARTLRPDGSFYISEPCRELTPVGRAIGASARVLMGMRGRMRGGGRDEEAPESVEEPIRSAELLAALSANGLAYEAEYVTHVPLIDRFMRDRSRRALAVAISRPWRRRRGDIVFVEGTKPGAERA
jgi:2-polyprenyl-3-methyl-5-hydroxy-6-metoxy-1,4-benzoquinol methylase